MSGEEFLLKWNDHHNSFFSIMQDLCSSEVLTDVTLACGGQVFETHKIMLCVCSSFFRSILTRRPDKHPIVFLKDIHPKHLEQLLQYMYHGEINVLQEDLAPLVEAARCLQIKGLSDAPASNQQQPRPPRSNNGGPPPMKKVKPLTNISNNHKRKAESPSQVVKSNNTFKGKPVAEHLEDMGLKEEHMDAWNAHSEEPDLSQGGSEYDSEVYQDQDGAPIQDEDHIMIPGSQNIDYHQGVAGVEGAVGSVKSSSSSAGSGGSQHVMQHPVFTSKNTVDEQKLRYRCDICGKGFVTPSKLQRHSYSHSGLRPFHCSFCGKSFSQSANLKTHVRNTHPDLLMDMSAVANAGGNSNDSSLPPPPSLSLMNLAPVDRSMLENMPQIELFAGRNVDSSGNSGSSRNITSPGGIDDDNSGGGSGAGHDSDSGQRESEH
ncbi:hypothetical protein TCAL_00079 [Tigriopus californicus]|uniref:BTB domain-containing protein n=1 Tax=Tigriopus californicus TaxID=6832 RepID=A0A553PFM4_TIGCA|nr:zinc finger and BTB domain-containing protein 14-like isoform X1 [Tigriopus californicus]TRY76488.1 hypothetical protein TCAL_00079 [Tigriopus californicus]